MEFITSGKHAGEMYAPLNPTFIYGKTGVCRGMPFFLFLVEAVLTCTLDLCFEQKYKKIYIKKILIKFSTFTAEKKICVYCMGKFSKCDLHIFN